MTKIKKSIVALLTIAFLSTSTFSMPVFAKQKSDVTERNISRNTTLQAVQSKLQVADRIGWMGYNSSKKVIEFKKNANSKEVYATVKVSGFNSVTVKTSALCSSKNNSKGYGKIETNKNKLWMCFNPETSDLGVRLEKLTSTPVPTPTPTPTPIPTNVIQYCFAGVMDEDFGTVNAGTAFTGKLSYKLTQSTNQPNYPNRGDYIFDTLQVTVNGKTTTGYNGPINVYNNATYPTDLFHAYASSPTGQIGGKSIYVSSVVLQDIEGQAFNNLSLPGSNLTLNDFTTGDATFIELQSEDHEANARGHLTSYALCA